jgi:hypothetical protein
MIRHRKPIVVTSLVVVAVLQTATRPVKFTEPPVLLPIMDKVVRENAT